jgi:hypothetical protein
MPVNQDLVAFISPGSNAAVDKALHKADPIKFHKRVRGDCPYCWKLPVVDEVANFDGEQFVEMRERMKQTLERIAKKQGES